MMKKHIVVALVMCSTALVACGKRGPSENRDTLGEKTFEFQVIKSPLTGKCYETVSHYDSYNFQRIFEVSCDFYKQKQ